MSSTKAEKDGLLSRKSYDADARNVGEEEPQSDVESQDDRLEDETSEDDHDVFGDDYEEGGSGQNAENVRRGLRGIFSRRGYGKVDSDEIPLQEKPASNARKPSRRHRERLKRGETDSELVYDMEEGGQASQSPSRNSSEVDLQRLKMAQVESTSMKRGHRLKKLGLHIAIILFFLTLLYGAYTATQSNRQAQEEVKLAMPLSNGTSLFAPTTILISLDGFRADFLERGLTPTLNRFIREGVSPLYMMPSFPSVTFPNHYTMVTGLYPEAHGIVGNTFWDPADEDEFYYTHPQQSLQAKWWGGEPVWLTAELQGIRTAVHMWPGSEAAIGDVPISHVDKYNGKEDLGRKVDRIFELLDLPGPDSPSSTAGNPRPQLIAAYVPNVDADGHGYGPNSTEIRQTIRNADEMLGEIFHGLQERNLTNIVNVIVVSDHGMATTSTDRVVQVEDLLDLNDIAHVDGWPLYGIRPKDPARLVPMYNQLKERTKDMPYLHVYLRDKDMPERYHFSKNPRIAPLWIVPDAGWAIAPKKEFDVAKAKKEGIAFQPRGLHGYDHEHSLMRAIFVARGPAFPHPAGSRIDNFQNTELYNIVCDTLGVKPAPNNGTIRLPFKTVGHHADSNAPKLDIPYDPPEVGVGEDTANVTPVTANPPVKPTPSMEPEGYDPPNQPSSLPQPSTSQPPADAEQPTPPNDPNKPNSHKWWDWIANAFEDARKKLKGMLGKDKGDDEA